MAYCTTSDMVDRFGEQELIDLTDRDQGGVIDDTVLARAIADASVAIDRKLRGRYSVPISPAPSELVPIACDLARWYLYDKAVTAHVKERADAANKELRDYATGVNVLDIPDEEVDTSPQAPSVVASAAVFTDATLGKMP